MGLRLSTTRDQMKYCVSRCHSTRWQNKSPVLRSISAVLTLPVLLKMDEAVGQNDVEAVTNDFKGRLLALNGVNSCPHKHSALPFLLLGVGYLPFLAFPIPSSLLPGGCNDFCFSCHCDRHFFLEGGCRLFGCWNIVDFMIVENILRVSLK